MTDAQQDIIYQTLELNLSSFEFFAKSVTQEESQTLRDVKPDGSAGWTVLEVICHLRDVERQFLLRLLSALQNKDKAFPVFKPEEVAIEQDYNSHSLAQAMQYFKENRTGLIKTFKTVQSDEWDYTGEHSSRGTTSVAEVLLQVSQHDAKHVRQLSRIFSKR